MKAIMKSSVYLIITLTLYLLVSLPSAYAVVVVIQPGPEGKDSDVSSGAYSLSNFGGDSDLITNYDGVVNHGLIEFDLSPIPPGAVINSATLEVMEYQNCSFNMNAIEVHANLAAWVESTVTWNNAPAYGPSLGTNTGETEGCDRLIFGVTASVQSWVGGTSTNYGFRLTGPANGNAIKYIWSSDDSEVPADRPILRVDYTAAAPPPVGGDPGPEANLIVNGNPYGEEVTVGNPVNLEFFLRYCGAGNELFLVLKAPAFGVPVFSYLTMAGQWVPLPADLSMILPFMLAPPDGKYPLFTGTMPKGRYEFYFGCDFAKNGHLDYLLGGINGVFDHVIVTVQ